MNLFLTPFQFPCIYLMFSSRSIFGFDFSFDPESGHDNWSLYCSHEDFLSNVSLLSVIVGWKTFIHDLHYLHVTKYHTQNKEERCRRKIQWAIPGPERRAKIVRDIFVLLIFQIMKETSTEDIGIVAKPHKYYALFTLYFMSTSQHVVSTTSSHVSGRLDTMNLMKHYLPFTSFNQNLIDKKIILLPLYDSFLKSSM